MAEWRWRVRAILDEVVPNHQLPLLYLQAKSANAGDASWNTGETFVDASQYYRITVTSMDSAANTATVSVRLGPLPGEIAGPPPGPVPAPTTGYSGGTGSLPACNTCGPNGKTPRGPIHFQ